MDPKAKAIGRDSILVPGTSSTINSISRVESISGNSLNKFIKAVNSNHNPLEKALISLTLISYIQPFADGNKRTARVLANAVLIAHDCYPVTFRNVEDTDYLKALLLFYEKTNLFNFKHMFLEQYRFALQNYFRT